MDLLDVLAAFEPPDRSRIHSAANMAGVALADFRQGADGTWFTDHRGRIVICRSAIRSAVPLPDFVRTDDGSRWPWYMELSGASS